MNAQLVNAIKRQKIEHSRLLALPSLSRSVTPALKEALNSKLIKVITGPRRSGKSTLAIQALNGLPHAYLNFEDEQLNHSSDELVDALDHVYGEVSYLLFDEIQEFEKWEVFLNKLHRRGRNLLVTGSNSRMLSSELASSLTGRHQAFKLFPFSLSEFTAARGELVSDQTKRAQLPAWLRTGGFPEVVIDKAGESYLRALFDAIVLKDVVGRYRIRNVPAIKSTVQLLINSISGRFTARSMERALGDVSFSTIQRYLAYLEEAFLFFDLQAFSFKSRLRLKSARKIFTVDNGFIHALAQNMLGGESAALENAVFIELLRKGFEPNLSLFYAQTKDGYEIDFLLPDYPQGATLIQVAFSILGSSAQERELRALDAAAEEFRANKLIIITADQEAKLEVSGRKVDVIPAWKWF